MKKAIALTLAASALTANINATAGGPDVSLPSNANQTGVYIDAGFGYGWNSNKTVPFGPVLGTVITNATASGSGFAWLAEAGYQFNRFIAMEIGYLSFPNSTANGSNIYTNFYGLDLVGKVILPVADNFNVFGKAGVVRLSSNVLQPFPGVGAISTTVTNGNKVDYSGVFAVGASYYFVTNFFADVQGTTTLASGVMPATYMLTAGLGYKFAI